MSKFGVIDYFITLIYPNYILDTLLFPDKDTYDLSFTIFLQSDLGQIYQSIPWKQLAKSFETNTPKSRFGRKPIFSIEGGLALMFLKHYLNLSDKKLIERINTDWQLQYFCGVKITITHPVRDKDIVSRWRKYFGIHMDIDKLQDILAAAWMPYLKQTHVLMDDATCYESYIKYPTDVKLLFDCTEYLFATINMICDILGIPCPRTKYKFQERKQANYAKLKRKPKKRTKKRIRELLYWTIRGLTILQDIFNQNPTLHNDLVLCAPIYEKIKLIKVIYGQQYQKFTSGNPRIKNRIVSFFKPYLRPIIRGKETKRVEFGAKVHTSQVDGINFIEHLSFDAFHEGIRMWKSIIKHKARFGKCSQYGADQIYASNKNRKYASQRGIGTCFKRKGRASKDENQKRILRQELGRARATILEGSFGNEKNHYGLKKVKARSKYTEIAWIFFGIHTANAVKIAKRMNNSTNLTKNESIAA